MARSMIKKDFPPRCEYCLHGNHTELSDEVFCVKRGVVKKNESCRKFRYDVLKRTPVLKKICGDFKPEDFSIN